MRTNRKLENEDAVDGSSGIIRTMRERRRVRRKTRRSIMMM